ncbi:MAG TPA: amidophosphoribosyltransferase [Vicinamibacteria bacterium]|nr:amidophosphoribosyltransferase [Vicinamibacteria bacterium]
MSGFRDECGVFGIFGHPDAARLTYLGLYALQHRGQEAAGIVTSGEKGFASRKRQGYVAEVFDAEALESLGGTNAIGHTRYSTSGESNNANTQPIHIECKFGEIAVCHNGNLVNAHVLRHGLVERGSIFRTTSDTEVILHLYAKSLQREPTDAIVDALRGVEGAFSLLFLTNDAIYGARDPRGFRPLVLGKLDSSYVLCSETCALDLIDATLVREIEPGELVRISPDGVRSYRPFPPAPASQCIFEHVYFARPDSHVFGRDVHRTRIAMGRTLAREAPADADVVVPVPDSGVVAAIGYSQESGLPMELGLIRNHYVGRTFIEPRQSIRNFGVKVKLNPVRSVIENRRIVLIDDSIVRGTTSRKIVGLVRQAGAKEVHFRVSSPPTTGPCHYGIDTPKHDELIASTHTVEEIAHFIGADSLGYLSHEGLLSAVETDRDRYCSACFSGNYPLALPEEGKDQLKLFEKVRD